MAAVSNPLTSFAKICEDKKLQCSICLGPYKDPYKISDCFHSFCRDCIAKTIQSMQNSCPQCKREYQITALKYDVILHKRICRLWQMHSKGLNPYREHRKKIPWASKKAAAIQQSQSQSLGSSSPSIGYLESSSSKQAPIPASILDKSDSSRDSYEGNHRHLDHISMGGNVKLNTCRVDGPTRIFWGTLNAVHSVLGEIQTQEEVTLEDCIVQQVIGVSSGKFLAINSSLYGGVQARNKITCKNSTFKTLKVFFKSAICTMDAPRFEEIQGDSIDAKGKVVLENIRLSGKVTSHNKKITATHCRLQSIKARFGVELDESSFASIECDVGEVVCKNRALDETHFQGDSIYAGSARLENINLSGRVWAAYSEVSATNCRLQAVRAHGRVILEKVRLSQEVASHREVRATGSTMNSVEAGDYIELQETVVIHSAKSKKTLQATNSQILGQATCVSSLELNHSLVGSATVSFIKEMGAAAKVTVFLNGDSKIEGDLVIRAEEIDPNNVSKGAPAYPISFKTKDLQFHEQDQTITIRGTYPFSVAARSMIDVKGSSLEISPSGGITSAGGKKVVLNGSLLKLEPKCMVEIKGSGTIGGKIRFEGCKGLAFGAWYNGFGELISLQTED